MKYPRVFLIGIRVINNQWVSISLFYLSFFFISDKIEILNM